MGAKRFKNGNINVRFDRSEIEEIMMGRVSNVEVFLWSLDAVDTYLIGEEYCLGNSAMGITMYSAYSDKVFRFHMGEFAELMAGRTVKLYAAEPTEDERELIG